MNCPIPNCVLPVEGPMRICRNHWKLVPRPQQDALSHYARTRKGGPAHEGAFLRAVETVTKLLAGRAPEAPARETTLPYRDD